LLDSCVTVIAKDNTNSSLITEKNSGYSDHKEVEEPLDTQKDTFQIVHANWASADVKYSMDMAIRKVHDAGSIGHLL